MQLSCLMACGILVPQSGIKQMSPALQGGYLTIGPPERPLFCVFILVLIAAQNCTLFDLYSEEFIKRQADIPQNYHKSQGTYDLLMCVCTSSGKGFSPLSHGEEPICCRLPAPRGLLCLSCGAHWIACLLDVPFFIPLPSSFPFPYPF